MNRRRIRRGLVSTLALAAITASCGGSNGDSENGVGPDSSAAEEGAGAATDVVTSDEEVGDEATNDDAAGDDEAPTTDADEQNTDSDDASDSGDATDCDSIFTMAEMEEFFGEPVNLVEETNDSIGQLVCTWESVEDPDNLEDLAAQTVLVQFYSGSPIEASAFFDPTMFESVTTIEGIGDLAFTTGSDGMDYSFVDEPVGGSLSYIAFDMGSADVQQPHTPEEVEALFRTFHERVT